MSADPRLFALIPAAGKSTRMGRSKLTLPLGDRTVLERVIEAFKSAAVDNVVVVLAPHCQDLMSLAISAGADALLLSEETPQMRVTIERGLDWLEQHFQPREHDFWLLSPADHPTLAPDVIQSLVTAHDANPAAGILIPVYQGKRGHPALVSWRHVPGIRALPPDRGLNAYFREQAHLTLEVPVTSPEILYDLDTPDDYENLLKRWPSNCCKD